jgi:hypothetical protein
MKRYCSLCKFNVKQDGMWEGFGECRYGPPEASSTRFPLIWLENFDKWCFRFESEDIEEEEECCIPDQTCTAGDITYEFKNGECHIYRGRKNK